MERRRLVVRGRVQGVWYRDSCRQRAEELRVAGWARNLEDGSVEVVMEGLPGSLDQLEQWCRTGPPRALVTAVETSPRLPVEGLSGFRAR